MTELPIPESVWWYVLAGFLLGFILSTLWEWLYFRSRRLRIENRRIAELEARVRSLTPPAGAADSPIAPGAAPPYQGPGVYLESEQSQNAGEVIATTSTVSAARSVQLSTAAPPPAGAGQPAAQTPSERDITAQSKSAKMVEQTSVRTVQSPVPTSEAAATVEPPLEQGPEQRPATTTARNLAAFTALTAREREAALDRQPDAGAAPVNSQQLYTPAQAAPSQAPTQTPAQAPAQAPVYDNRNGAAYRNGFTPAAAGTPEITSSNSTAPDSTAPDSAAPAAAAPETSTPAAAPLASTPDALPPTAAASASAVQSAQTQDSGEPNPIEQEGRAARIVTAAAAASMAAVRAIRKAQQDADRPTQDAPPVEASTITAPAAAVQDSTEQGARMAAAAAAGMAAVLGGEDAQQDAAPTVQEAQAARMAAAAAAAGMAAVLGGEGEGDYAQQDAALTVQNAPTQETTEQETTEQETQAGRMAAAAAAAGMAAVFAAEDTQQNADLAVQDLALAESSAPAAPASPALASILPVAPKATNRGDASPMRAGGAAVQSVPPTGIQPGIQRVSGELDNLLTSLQGLIETTDPLLDGAAGGETDRLTLMTSAASVQVADAEGITGPYAAKNLSRGEYAVVRLMQSVRRFGRELRSLYQGE